MFFLGVPHYWVDDACHSEDDPPPDDVVGSWRPEDELHGVRCCTNSKCVWGHSCEKVGKTYQEAVQICADRKKKLCTKEQLLSDMCCGQAGDCDNNAVWTLTPQYEGKFGIT